MNRFKFRDLLFKFFFFGEYFLLSLSFHIVLHLAYIIFMLFKHLCDLGLSYSSNFLLSFFDYIFFIILSPCSRLGHPIVFGLFELVFKLIVEYFLLFLELMSQLYNISIFLFKTVSKLLFLRGEFIQISNVFFSFFLLLF